MSVNAILTEIIAFSGISIKSVHCLLLYDSFAIRLGFYTSSVMNFFRVWLLTYDRLPNR